MLSLSIKEVIQQIKQGRLSAKDVCDKCIARANKISELNAYVTRTSELAEEQAMEASSRYKHKDARAMEGIPVAVKDNFCTKGIRTSCASRMLENYIPPYTATVVNKLLTNGAVLMGKTNLDEYAMGCGSVDSIFGPVRNPWKYNFGEERLQEQEEISAGHHGNQTLHGSRYIHTSARNKAQPETQEVNGDEDDNWFIAGGSSGGSAVAVATHSCFGALGSDTGGSVRNPASYCGIVGLKPTYGLLSRHGLIPLVNSLDVPGILTNCVDDAVTLFNLLAGHDVKDSTTVRDKFTPQEIPDDISVQGLTVGIPKEYHSPGLSQEIAAAWRAAADVFENAGARVVEVSLPHTRYSIVTYSVLCACEVASNMARYDGIEFGHRAGKGQSTEELYAHSRHEGFNDVVAGRIFAGNYFLLKQNYDQYFIKAQKVRRLISDDFKKVFAGGVDVLLTPTTLTEAPLYSWFKEQDNRTRTAEQDVFTQPVNLAGIPAVSLPVGLSSNGLPLSLQLIGQNFKDHDMLQAAKWLEQQMNFQRLNLDYLDNFSL